MDRRIEDDETSTDKRKHKSTIAKYIGRAAQSPVRKITASARG